MAWNKVYPTLSGDTISASVTQIQANWSAIEGVLSGEHASLTNSLSGTHLYGRTSVMFSGTKAQIDALSSPNTGALAWDTQCGTCKIYTGSTWASITSSYFSRVHLSLTSPQAIGPGTWTSVIFNNESYDGLDEYSINSNILQLTGAGWYLGIGTIIWPTETTLDYQKIAAIYLGTTTRKAVDVKYGKETTTCEVADVIYFEASSTIYLGAYHSHSENRSIQSASLIITRLS